jgi:hypothetical protein
MAFFGYKSFQHLDTALHTIEPCLFSTLAGIDCEGVGSGLRLPKVESARETLTFSDIG